jgi:hypothetical protein
MVVMRTITKDSRFLHAASQVIHSRESFIISTLKVQSLTVVLFGVKSVENLANIASAEQQTIGSMSEGQFVHQGGGGVAAEGIKAVVNSEGERVQ